MKIFDIREFGAVGDGATLNTQAIQNAIDQCAAENGGRVIFIDTAPKYFETGEEINKSLEYISLEELSLQDGLVQEQPFKITGDDIYVSPYVLNGKRLSYVINLTEEDREITVINGRIYDPEDNTYTENEKYVLKAERGVFIFER